MRNKSYLVAGLICLVIGVAALVLLLAGCENDVQPLSPTVIVGYSGSMRPTFVGGEVRTVIHKPFDDLQKGDIALSFFGGGWHPHRLTTKHLGRWKSKGDANCCEDVYQMGPENYGGVILAVEKLG